MLFRSRLRVAVEAAQMRGDALGHVLFDGPPGLGKTTFALCIPREIGATVQLTSGAILKAPKDLIPYLSNAGEKSVLFIDEIHRLPKSVEEYLYTAMEDFRIDIVLGDGVSARTINLHLKPFTLIGATTRAGLLSGPLRDRFQIRETLGFYTIGELTEIIRRSAGKLEIPIDDEAAINMNRVTTEIVRTARTHQMANDTVATPIVITAAVPAASVLPWESASLSRVVRSRIDAVDFLVPIPGVSLSKPGHEIFKFGRFKERQMRSIVIGRSLRIFLW